jgi:seryl-tRNA synthetase
MHDIKWIRDNAAAFDAGLARRGLAGEASRLIGLDETRRAVIAQLQEAQSHRNAISKEIGQAMAQKDMARAESLKAEVTALKDTTPALETAERKAIAALDKALASIPNLPKADVPDGADEHGNVVYRTYGKKPEEAGGRLFGINNLKEHFEIGEALGQMDFDAAAKMSGSRFVVLNRGIARLSRALGQFFLDTHTAEHGYDEVMPPLLVRDDAMFGTAQLPKFLDDLFTVGGVISETVATGSQMQSIPQQELRQLWLIPTAEVPLTNLVRESIIDEDTLPRRYTALTPCFRAEAGSAGRDTRGMLRQHQFDKVELVSITTPDKSAAEHERMLECAENVLKKLGLHFRTMVLCTGDMGFASQKTYDIEVWLPGQKAYREISSCSVCGDFQARRMKAQYRPKDAAKGALPFVHTLNGSGVAVGRALIAVIENYQNADGSITVPDALLPYMGGATRVG